MLTDSQKNAWSFTPARECSCPPCPMQISRAEMQSQARWGRRDSFSKASNGCSGPICPSPKQPLRSSSAGRTRAAVDQSGSAPQRARVPACDEHTVPSHVAAPPRGRKPSFKGREAGGARVSGGGCSPVFVIIRNRSESFRSWDNY